MGFPIKVLQVTIGDGSFGGVASFLYTYYRHMDHSKVHFDFLYCGENSMQSKEGDSVLEGSTIITLHILKRNNNGFSEYKKLLPALKKIFDENNYDIVHVNSSNPYVNACVAFALKGRKVYIAHSHNAQSTIIYGSKAKQAIKNLIGGTVHKYIVKKADAMYACSKEAGEYLFGKEGITSEKFRVINNAIDTTKYAFNPDIRGALRNDENSLIVGFVGRLSDQKNPEFAIDVFAEVIKRRPEAVFWMIGEGELKGRVQNKIEELQLQEKVKLLGRRNDVSELMQAMDILLFPSVYEGLGIVAIEAQCSGLQVVASDRVPQAANVAGLISYFSLAKSATYWADEVVRLFDENKDRKDMSEIVKEEKYDIASEARKLELYYSDLISRAAKSLNSTM